MIRKIQHPWYCKVLYECKINQQLKSRDPSVFRIRIKQLLVWIQTKPYTKCTHIKFIQILLITNMPHYTAKRAYYHHKWHCTKKNGSVEILFWAYNTAIAQKEKKSISFFLTWHKLGGNQCSVTKSAVTDISAIIFRAHWSVSRFNL